MANDKKIFLPGVNVSFVLNGEWSDLPAGSVQTTDSSALSMKGEGYFTLMSMYASPQNDVMQFNQDERTISEIHKAGLDSNSGLLELQSLTTSHGINIVYRLVKRLISDDVGNNMSYILTIDIYGDDKDIWRIQVVTASSNLLDVRNSAVRQQFMEDKGISLISGDQKQLNITTGWSYDPYDSNFTKGILMNLSERREYDDLFPNHPLSVARRILKEIIETICSNEPTAQP